MHKLACLLSLSLLSSCYGLHPQPARIFTDSQAPQALPELHKLALIATDGQNLSPAGPAWQQAGLVKMHSLLQAQGLPLADLAPAVSASRSLLEQGFPSLVPVNMPEWLSQTAAAQGADWVLLLKQNPRPDLRVGFFERQVRYSCDVALEAYSSAQQRYLFQIKATGENGYQSFAQSATLLGLTTGTIIAPAIRLGFGSEPAQQQQSAQIITWTQLLAGIGILSILSWDLIQTPISPEERQNLACQQALQEAAKSLAQLVGEVYTIKARQTPQP